jgi:hypothetical protein
MNRIPLSRASQILGLSREQCMRRIFQGALKAEMIDGRWLVETDSVAEFQQRSRATEVAHA